MTSPIPDARSIRLPPVRKTAYHCCGYSAYMGDGRPWECPACHRVHGAPQLPPRAHRIVLTAGAPRSQ